jgi:hypothetical protein
MSQPTLFGVEAGLIVHKITPSMALACGVGILDKPATERMTTGWAGVTCPACLDSQFPADNPRCHKCGGQAALATGVCVDCGHDILGYFDDDPQSGDPE